jgi:hypothetical protein
MRILMRHDQVDQKVGQLSDLLTRLPSVGINLAGGGRLDDDDVVLIDGDKDAQRAIDLLAKKGIAARRG